MPQNSASVEDALESILRIPSSNEVAIVLKFSPTKSIWRVDTTCYSAQDSNAGLT